jgi:hypothetical protein
MRSAARLGILFAGIENNKDVFLFSYFYKMAILKVNIVLLHLLIGAEGTRLQRAHLTTRGKRVPGAEINSLI